VKACRCLRAPRRTVTSTVRRSPRHRRRRQEGHPSSGSLRAT
jgi:hypothetical protein